ncbi:MAG: choice-of-anchor tandem repeat GloVer-containing protein [Bacteroidota bacterium]
MKNHLPVPLVLISLFTLGLTPISQLTAQTFTVLHHFNLLSEGVGPATSEALTFSGDTLFGVTSHGGVNDKGVLFSIMNTGTNYNAIYTFSALNNGYNTDGALPITTLKIVGNKVYGTATAGGTLGNGTLFSVNPDGTGFTTLFNFSGVTPNTSYALHSPAGELVLSGDTLYGVTFAGGSPTTGGSTFGRVFAVSTNGGGTTTYTFLTSAPGYGPNAGLVLLNNSLYGTTKSGGTGGNGTVFKVNTDGSGFLPLHNFTNLEGVPQAPLVLSGNTLYGTTYNGGSDGRGLVFAINVTGSGFIVLHTFDVPGGYTSQSGLLLAGDMLFGSTLYGGRIGSGTVFSMKTDGTKYTVLHSFDRYPDGAAPSRLIKSGSTLYGMTSYGGSYDKGTIFSLSSLPVAINFNTTTLSFGSAKVGQFRDTAITITNTGDDTLKISNVTSVNAVFSVRPTQLTIAPGTSANDTLRFTPAGITAYSGKVIFTSNAASLRDTTSVSGTGISATGVNELLSRIPQEYVLLQNFPNPFNPATTIQYALPARSIVRITIHNVLGEMLSELVHGEKETGYHELRWDGQLPSGMYFYRLEAIQADDATMRFVVVKKMVLIR